MDCLCTFLDWSGTLVDWSDILDGLIGHLSRLIGHITWTERAPCLTYQEPQIWTDQSPRWYNRAPCCPDQVPGWTDQAPCCPDRAPQRDWWGTSASPIGHLAELIGHLAELIGHLVKQIGQLSWTDRAPQLARAGSLAGPIVKILKNTSIGGALKN